MFVTFMKNLKTMLFKQFFLGSGFFDFKRYIPTANSLFLDICDLI